MHKLKPERKVKRRRKYSGASNKREKRNGEEEERKTRQEKESLIPIHCSILQKSRDSNFRLFPITLKVLRHLKLHISYKANLHHNSHICGPSRGLGGVHKT